MRGNGFYLEVLKGRKVEEFNESECEKWKNEMGMKADLETALF